MPNYEYFKAILHNLRKTDLKIMIVREIAIVIPKTFYFNLYS